jgi:hypothetical protein
LYAVHAQVCKNRAFEVVGQVRNRSGLCAWYELNQEYAAPTTTVNDLQAILKFDFGSASAFRSNLLKWENKIADYANVTGETLSDRIRIAVLLGQAPSEVRSYLKMMAKQSYSEVRTQLLTYLDNSEGEAVPMEVGWVGKASDYGKGKMGKKGKHKGDGKHQGDHLVKGKIYKGDGKRKPDGQVKGKFKESGKHSMEKAPATSSFQGYCKGCGRWGHRLAEC